MYTPTPAFFRTRLASLLGAALLASSTPALASLEEPAQIVGLISQSESMYHCPAPSWQDTLAAFKPDNTAAVAPQAASAPTPAQEPAPHPVVAAISPSQDKPLPLGGTFGFIAKIPGSLAKSTSALSSHIAAKFKVDPEVSEKVVASSLEASKNMRIPASLILAVIAVESGFKAEAKNGNATGLMQIIPYWHKEKVNEIGGTKELWKIEKNIATGAKILREYLDRSKGNLFNAIYRYNASAHANEYAKKVLKEQDKFEKVAEDTAPPAPKLE